MCEHQGNVPHESLERVLWLIRINFENIDIYTFGVGKALFLFACGRPRQRFPMDLLTLCSWLTVRRDVKHVAQW